MRKDFILDILVDWQKLYMVMLDDGLFEIIDGVKFDDFEVFLIS